MFLRTFWASLRRLYNKLMGARENIITNVDKIATTTYFDLDKILYKTEGQTVLSALNGVHNGITGLYDAYIVLNNPIGEKMFPISQFELIRDDGVRISTYPDNMLSAAVVTTSVSTSEIKYYVAYQGPLSGGSDVSAYTLTYTSVFLNI